MIYLDETDSEDFHKAASAGLTLLKFDKVLAEGKLLSKSGIKWDPINEDTFYTFSYTSGTTGVPKGVKLTHLNFVANIGSMDLMREYGGAHTWYTEDDVYISYLPLAHVYERLLLLTSMAVKIQVGFYSGDVLKLTQDLAVLKPTVMISVPRLFTRFYDLMQAKIKELTGIKKTMAEWGIQKKLAALKQSAKTTDLFYDALVFNKFKEILGGRVRFMVSGAAPI